MLAHHPGCNPLCHACHYKALSPQEQFARKQAWAQTQLEAWSAVSMPLQEAPEAERLGYRSKTWLRVRLQSRGEDGVLEASFGMLKSVRPEGEKKRWEQELIVWDTCPLHTEEIQQWIQGWKARVRDLSVEERSLLALHWAGVWVTGGQAVFVSRSPELRALFQKWDWKSILGDSSRAWFHVNPQVGKRILGHLPVEPLVRGEGVRQRGADPGLGFAFRAFRQVAQTLLEQARSEAVRALQEMGVRQVLDLYCGSGELSVQLPPDWGWIGIELQKEAVQVAQAYGEQRPHSTLHQAWVGGVEQRLADPRVFQSLQDPYAIYLNPPRSGLTDEAREILARWVQEKPPQGWVYLSCSASRLARDLRHLESWGYFVEKWIPYDFFPQTEHFEVLAVLKRR
jgi:tRNA/tmRNA/rRNA uracil-C5-methylase (TrmA/RlmC/RlmD family)